ncbi:MAG: hypothetical protein HXS46_20160 [Theionarchaea archaeon]|nr:hypothetical protein [Theionarchaea archaeon]
MTRKEKAVLEGYLGDWAQKSYFKALVEKARQEKIELYAVDVKSPPFAEPYKNGIYFVDKKLDVTQYDTIDNVDYVFTAAPHEFHCAIAEHWLKKGKLNKNGQIFIEKPLDSSVSNIEKLETIKGAKEKIIAIDHYIPKILPLIKELEENKKRYGKILKMRFNILESDPILESRRKTLDEGLILDIYPHILAIFTKIMNTQNKFQLKASTFEILDVYTGKYELAPITGETFAHIVARIEEIGIENYIGKAVGAGDSKILKILFEKGSLMADFVSGQFLLRTEDGEIPGHLQKRHISFLLDDIIDREFRRDEFLSKSLDFDEAFEIVKIISIIREKSNIPMEYKKFSPLDDILMKFNNPEMTK